MLFGGLIGGCAGFAIGLAWTGQTEWAITMLAVAIFLVIGRVEL
jgi:hypothetical protein